MRSLSDNLFHNDLFSAVVCRIVGSRKVEYGVDELKLRCEYRIKASELSDKGSEETSGSSSLIRVTEKDHTQKRIFCLKQS